MGRLRPGVHWWDWGMGRLRAGVHWWDWGMGRLRPGVLLHWTKTLSRSDFPPWAQSAPHWPRGRRSGQIVSLIAGETVNSRVPQYWHRYIDRESTVHWTQGHCSQGGDNNTMEDYWFGLVNSHIFRPTDRNTHSPTAVCRSCQWSEEINRLHKTLKVSHKSFVTKWLLKVKVSLCQNWRTLVNRCHDGTH